MITKTTDLDYLIPEFRIYISDYSTPFQYTDEFLRTCLITALKTLGRRWHNRYFIELNSETDNYDVTRNSSITTFNVDSPPIIENADEAVIILQATIILKSAVMYDSTWDVASWKDDEISYSNLQGAKYRDESIKRDLALLEDLLKGRLHPGKAQSMPGFHLPYNITEGEL